MGVADVDGTSDGTSSAEKPLSLISEMMLSDVLDTSADIDFRIEWFLFAFAFNSEKREGLFAAVPADSAEITAGAPLLSSFNISDISTMPFPLQA